MTFDKFYATDNNGKVLVRKDKIEKFLENLGVTKFIVNDVYENESFNTDLTEEELRKNNSDRTTYTINGNNVGGKCNVAFEAIKMFALNHIDYSPEQIIESWTNLKIKHLPHLIETEETHQKRKEKSTDLKFDDKSKRLDVNGRVFYVSNQFNPERIEELKDKVNKQNWGIRIEVQK